MADQQKLRVLVVDDEQVIAHTLAIILNQGGFAAAAFTNPLLALESARMERPDLVISDVVMPELSGIDLAIEVKALCPNCKILLFSGQAATTDLLKIARDNGHNFELLSKPVHPTDLLNAIRKLGK